MAGDTIKDFLVSLGFNIDSNSEKKFKDAIEGATIKAAILGEVAVKVAEDVVKSFAQMAGGIEDLYFASIRIHSSAENIKAFGYAVANMGGTADGATASLESLAKFMRTNPGSDGFLHQLGADTHDANGNLRDTTDIMADLGKKFSSMPYYQAKMYGDTLGIDEKTLMALIAGTKQFGDKYKEMLRSSGVDAQKAAEQAHNFEMRIRDLKAHMEIWAMKAMEWFDSVSEFAEKLATRVGKAFVEIKDWFDSLDPGIQLVIEAVGGITAAVIAMNLAWALSPVGLIAALGVGILALYDDYKTWKEGGKSLINWGDWEPAITAATNGIKILGGAIKDAFEWMEKLANKVLSKETKDMIGDVTAHIAAKLGSKEAQHAIDVNEGRISASATKPVITPKPAQSIAGTERGIRNNNPGNLNYVGQTGAHKEAGENGRFAVFSTPQEGLDALAKQLRLYGQRGTDRVQTIISKFAPASENNTQAYIESVAKGLGVGANAHLDLNDPKVIKALSSAIIKVENGRNPYSDEQLSKAAASSGSIQVAGSKAAPQITQTTTINVQASGNSVETAKKVAAEQNSVNANLIRNTAGAVG